MRSYIAMLGILVLLSIVSQPATAARFSIYTFDSDSNALLQSAYVSIWQGSILVDSGLTDNSGAFITYLDDGSNYRIRAEFNNKWDEKTDYAANSASSNQINLYLHP